VGPLCALQGMYAGMPVPEELKVKGSSSFAFLEKDLDVAQPSAAS
jgi:hypothetical protein